MTGIKKFIVASHGTMIAALAFLIFVLSSGVDNGILKLLAVVGIFWYICSGCIIYYLVHLWTRD